MKIFFYSVTLKKKKSLIWNCSVKKYFAAVWNISEAIPALLLDSMFIPSFHAALFQSEVAKEKLQRKTPSIFPFLFYFLNFFVEVQY